MRRFHVALLLLVIAFAALTGEILWGDGVIWGAYDEGIIWGALGDSTDTVVWGN
jgi:hypothetical protein